MAIVKGVGRDQGFMQMLSLVNQMKRDKEARIDKKIAREGGSIQDLIKLADSREKLENLKPALDNFVSFADNSGRDVVADVAESLYVEKNEAIMRGQEGYDNLLTMHNDMPFNKVYDASLSEEERNKLKLTDQNAYMENLLNKSVFDIQRELVSLWSSQEQMENAQKLGIEFKGSDKISPETLKFNVQLYESHLSNKLNLLTSRKVFDIDGEDSDLKRLQAEFGPAMLTFSDDEFGRYLEGQKQLLMKRIEKEQSLQLHYSDKAMVANNTAQAIQNSSDDEVMISLLEQRDDFESYLSAADYTARSNEFLKNAQDLNELYKDLYGEYYLDKDTYKEGGKDILTPDQISDEDIINDLIIDIDSTNTNNLDENIVKKEKELKLQEKDEKIDTERKFDESAVFPVIIKDENGNTLNFGLPNYDIHKNEKNEKHSKFQSNLSKNISNNDFKKSILNSIALTLDNKKIVIKDYNINKGFVVDENNVKHSITDVKIQDTTSILPALKKANGHLWFYNPIKNSHDKWIDKKEIAVDGVFKNLPYKKIGRNEFYFYKGEWARIKEGKIQKVDRKHWVDDKDVFAREPKSSLELK